MAHVLSAVWIVLLVTVFRTCEGASTVGQIREASAKLRVVVIVSTNHEPNGKYKMTIRLTNPPNNPLSSKMLPEKDWQILFHHENRLKPTVSKDGQLVLHAAESCLYVIAPVKGKYNGIARGQTKLIELEGTGLSIFKSIVIPNFAIYTQSIPPMNIASTGDDKLSFVYLDDRNKSMDDLSLMQGSRRLAITPDVVDQGRVPLTSFTIPAPGRVQGELGNIFVLSASQRINYYFHPNIRQDFANKFIADLAKIQGVEIAKLIKVSTYIQGEDILNVTLVDPNSAAAQGMSDDGYNFTVTPKATAAGTRFDVLLIAKHIDGLNRAKATMFSIMGIYDAIPHIAFQDDTSFGWRSVEIDLTSNFFGLSTLKKLVDIMHMYKLRDMVMVLGDNKAWRLEVADYGFEELHTFGSKRCVDLNQCMPSWLGAGATGTTSTNGYLSRYEFSELIRYAELNGVHVIPKINFLGGMLAAKTASMRRYDKLKEQNMASAQQFLLIAGQPTGEKAPADEYCLKDAALNPCIPQTESFIRLIVKYIHNLYSNASVEMKAFHAGGDDWVNSYEYYPECKQQQLDKPALLRKMVAMVQNVSPVDVVVNEQAVVDTTTMACIPAQDSSTSRGDTINKTTLIVQFKDDFLVDPKKLGLNKQEEDFLFAPIEPPPPPGNQTAADAYVPDFRKRYTGTTRGIRAPWGKAYRCGNAGYQFVLTPESYTDLESGNELSWDEIGHHKRDRYSTINRQRIMLLEPYNIYINIDRDVQMIPILPYRIAQLVESPELTTVGAGNLKGIGATIGTQVLRNETALFEHTTARLATVAEKAWRRTAYENTLKPTDLTTYEAHYTNETLAQIRSNSLLMEIMQHMNTWGYKQKGIHDAQGIPYRVGRVSAGIANGLLGFPPTPPPWQVIVKADDVGSPIQFRDDTNSTWRNLYETDDRGNMFGGYAMPFPLPSRRLELRLTSADGKRSSIPTVLYPNARNLIPAGVPVNLREDTCLDVKQPDLDITKINTNQWAKIINNIAVQNAEVNQFGQQRMQQLNGFLERYKREAPANMRQQAAALTLMEVMNGIEQLMAMQQPLYGPYQYIYDQDRQIIQARERALQAKIERWQQKYLNDPKCPKPKKTKSRV